MLRQRETLLWLFFMPPVFFYFIGTVTGGFGSAALGGGPPLAVQAPANGGLVVDQLVARLEQQGYAVARPATREAFEPFGRRLVVPDVSTGATFTDYLLARHRLEMK